MELIVTIGHWYTFISGGIIDSQLPWNRVSFSPCSTFCSIFRVRSTILTFFFQMYFSISFVGCCHSNDRCWIQSKFMFLLFVAFEKNIVWIRQFGIHSGINGGWNSFVLRRNTFYIFIRLPCASFKYAFVYSPEKCLTHRWQGCIFDYPRFYRTRPRLLSVVYTRWGHGVRVDCLQAANMNRKLNIKCIIHHAICFATSSDKKKHIYNIYMTKWRCSSYCRQTDIGETIGRAAMGNNYSVVSADSWLSTTKRQLFSFEICLYNP